MSKAPPHEDFLRLNDKELYEECDRRREAQNSAAGGFRTVHGNMARAFRYQQLMRDAYSEDYRKRLENDVLEELLDAQEKDILGRLDNYISTTERLLDALKEMKRRL
jgi:t-SNARE complex subunit (syntaxin)